MAGLRRLAAVLCAMWMAVAGWAMLAAAGAQAVGENVLRLPHVTVEPGQEISVALALTYNTGPIASADLQVTYDPAVVTVVQVSKGSAVAGAGWTLASNWTTPGLVRVALATGSAPLSTGGDLLYLTLRAVSGPGSTPLTLAQGDLNEGQAPSTLQSGSLQVSEATFTPTSTSTPVATRTTTATATGTSTPTPTGTATPVATGDPPITTVILSETGGALAGPVGNQDASITVPPGAVSEPIRLTLQAVQNPPDAGKFAVLGQAIRIEAQTLASAPVTQFNQPLTLVIRYSEADIAGLEENSLQLFYWDQTQGRWVAIPTIVDVTANTLTAQVDHLTLFAVMYNPAAPANHLYLPAIAR